jgi:Holliday junction resolvasome RuvABC endonuclease subunit
MTARVLGIDPSLTATGVASSAGWADTTGCTGKRTDGYLERHSRVQRVAGLVGDLISGPDMVELIVIEGPSYGSKDPSFFDRAWLWWGIYNLAVKSDIPIVVAAPSQLKIYATGKGNASKGAVIDAVARRWPGYLTDGDDNAADAVVLMAMGLDWLHRPLTVMPATHRRALDKVAWPDLGAVRA